MPDPGAWSDLPGRSRTGLILGVLLAVGLGRALARPGDTLSRLLLAHAGAALLSAVAQGESGHPNGYRYVYLTLPAALAIASGLLALVGCVPPRGWRAAAIAGAGAIAIAGTLGARDAVLVWPEARPTFTHFRGCETLLGEAAYRWSRYGPTEIEDRDETRIARIVYRYSLVRPPGPAPGGRMRAPSSFRVTLAAPVGVTPGERIVVRVVTPWNVPCGAVLSQPFVPNGGRERSAP